MTTRGKKLIWACVAGLVIAVTAVLTVGALRYGGSGKADCAEIGVEGPECPDKRAMG